MHWLQNVLARLLVLSYAYSDIHSKFSWLQWEEDGVIKAFPIFGMCESSADSLNLKQQ